MTESAYLKFNWKTLRWILLLGFIPPTYFHVRYYVIFEFSKSDSLGGFLFWTGISVVALVLLSILIFEEIKVIDHYLPWKHSVAKRLSVELVVTMVTIGLSMTILARITYPWHCAFFSENIAFRAHLMEELSIGIVMLLIILSFVEGGYFFAEWKKGLVLTEQLKKESLQAQLESLKNQVNPHFLFNSLNVLSNLVHKDADRAEEFIDQFAWVYRYVLNIQDKTAVTLGDELDFVDAYIFLQKIRFPNAFEVDIDISGECNSHYIVPLSVQMMLENAIKHNVVSQEEPLRVRIHLDGDYVCVENKINPRSDVNHSVGMGLKNLRQRYLLLAGITPEIHQDQGVFYARIPLLKPEKGENDSYESECCYHRRRKACRREA